MVMGKLRATSVQFGTSKLLVDLKHVYALIKLTLI
jgi:hypothetical protein